MSSRKSRRTFLKTASLATTGYWVAGGIQAAESRSPNEKLNVGIIGVWGRGRANTNGVKGENITALCDIDENYLDKVKGNFPKAKTYTDWRKLVDQKDLDAVVISTADQVHALASCWAMRRGLSVYCEKPLAHSVHEARTVRETYVANKDKVATQMGTQIHASENFRRVVELIQAKAIGDVREVHAWCARNGPGGGLPEGEDPCPKNLHWDLWLGPAPFRPYNKRYMPGNLTWNRWWDFGNGTLGDMGSHVIDLPFWALKLRQPTSVETNGEPTPASKFTNAKWMQITWEHPATDERPGLKLHWHDGAKHPELPYGQAIKNWRGLGMLFIGDKGAVISNYSKHVLLPDDKFKDYKRPEQTIPKSKGQHGEWIHACKTGDPTLCNFDYSGMLIEHNLLGNVAYRVGKKIDWDPKNLKAKNCPEADQFIRREYRKGWSLEG